MRAGQAPRRHFSAARNPALPRAPAPLLAQALLLTAYEKMLVAEPNNAALREAVEAVLARYSGTMDAELAQRAIEYRQLAARLDVARAAVQPLPKWEKRASLLLRRLAEKEVGGIGMRGAAGCEPKAGHAGRWRRQRMQPATVDECAQRSGPYGVAALLGPVVMLWRPAAL